MSLVLKLDKMRPELLAAALAAAVDPPPQSEFIKAQDRVQQVKSRKYKLLPAQMHKANALMASKGRPAYDAFLLEEQTRFEETRAADLAEALDALDALERVRYLSTAEGVLLCALELGLARFAEKDPAVAKALEGRATL